MNTSLTPAQNALLAEVRSPAFQKRLRKAQQILSSGSKRRTKAEMSAHFAEMRAKNAAYKAETARLVALYKAGGIDKDGLFALYDARDSANVGEVTGIAARMALGRLTLQR